LPGRGRLHIPRFARDDNGGSSACETPVAFLQFEPLLPIAALIKIMVHKITLIPGDGIGPEVTQATVRILEATGVKFEWETFMAGAEAFEKYNEYIPKELVESIERTHVGLKGPVTTPIGGGFASINVALRQKFELYANFRPIRNLPHIPTRYPDVDLIIVRENTESLYSGIEHEVVPGVVESIKIITEKASTRIARFAFEYARKNSRKKIHAIHKANIMKLSDGLFLRCARNVAKDYPEITYGEHIVDNTCMQLVMNPYQYDMLVMENLYGDIISDLCAAFVGGLGFVPSANLGDHCAIFEAVHGSAPDIAGKNLANPTAILRSALLMLRHLGEHDAALKIRNALENVYRTRDKLTRDVGGKAGTSEFADFIIEAMESGDTPPVANPS
jgi:isocitrate dehydrogenase (NAD+)